MASRTKKARAGLTQHQRRNWQRHSLPGEGIIQFSQRIKKLQNEAKSEPKTTFFTPWFYSGLSEKK